MNKRFMSFFIVLVVLLGLPLVCVAGDLESLVVTETGNVGIGTPEPKARLVVGSNFGSNISGSDEGIGIFGSNMAVYESGANKGKIYTLEKQDSNYGYSGISSTWGRLDFYANGGNTKNGEIVTPVPKMTIKQEGYIGIGTTNPTKKLEVSGGSVKINQNFSTNGFDPDSGYPVGWGGGIHTWDIYAEGTIGVGTEGGNLKAYMCRNGTIHAQNFGIGTMTPTKKMEIKGGSIKVDGKIGTNGYDPDSGYPGGWGGGIHTWDVYAESTIGAGHSGHLSAYMDRNGTVLAHRYNTVSDSRRKRNITPLEDSLSKITQLNGVTYEWTDKRIDNGTQIGVIAQEVEKVFPEMVSTEENGYKSVQYNALIAPLIESIKTLKKENETLRADMDKIKKRLEKAGL